MYVRSSESDVELIRFDWHGQICTDWTILNALIDNMRLENFFVFGLRNFSRKTDKVRFLAFIPIFDRPLQEK